MAEKALANLDAISNEKGRQDLVGGLNQATKFVQKAAKALDIALA